ncbi:uncharacterized protein LOC113276512 isoform X2 [Papaver somniferum]|uniref:uncharacterized protein LOC113276512 isoform X2 n=1 Tax=Papaver somniferum TaxID=3469 RepID=UPI000E700171|nr:uncharacterized protein LOC113276512 isoform X2 [Papaver somniferum]
MLCFRRQCRIRTTMKRNSRKKFCQRSWDLIKFVQNFTSMLLVIQARRVMAKLETSTKFINVVVVAFPLVVPFMSSTSRKMTCTMRGGRLHGLSLPSDMPYCSPFCVSYVHFGHHHSFQQRGYSVNITLYGDKSINVLSRSRCYWD